jgi:cobalt-zinc-cadmium resistance protein CzcA
VKEAYFRWVHQISINSLILQESDLYEELLHISMLRFERNDSLILEKTIAELKFAEIQRKVLLSEEQLKITINALNRQIYSEEPVQPAIKELDLYTIRFPQGQTDKFYPYTFKDYFQQQVNQINAGLMLEKSYLFPGISAGYFYQRVGPVNKLQGIQIGLSVPLWFQPQASRIKEARIHRDMALNDATLKNYELEQTIDDLKIKLDQEFINVIYFRENALSQAELLIEIAGVKLQKEAITYTQYLQSISEALKIKEEYLRSILNYNLAAIELEYYLN